MKRRALALTDWFATRAFVRVLRYWRWRTGKPAIVTMHSPELATELYARERMN